MDNQFPNDNWLNGTAHYKWSSKPTVLNLGKQNQYGYKCLCGEYLERVDKTKGQKGAVRPMYFCQCGKTYCAFTLRECII